MDNRFYREPIPAEEIAKAAAETLKPELFEPKLRAIADDLYGKLLDDVQTYLIDNATWNIGSRLRIAEESAQRFREALIAIRDLERKPFQMPEDWSAQIAACAECKRYEGHPIQRGICDTHRRPLWDREKHDAHEEKALGYRAKQIAGDALCGITRPNPEAAS